MTTIITVAALLLAGGFYYFRNPILAKIHAKLSDAASASTPEPSDPAYPHATPPDHVEPAPPNSGDTLGPDEQGRIRIPEVEALGGDWAKVWWYAPWVLQSHGSTFPSTVEWQLRFACGCDEHGTLGPCPNRGFEDGQGNMSVYSSLVPRKFVYGVDRYGRSTVFAASTTDYVENGVIHQATQRGEPIWITDKLTRATRATDGAELASFLKAHPDYSPVPESGPLGPEWDIG